MCFGSKISFIISEIHYNEVCYFKGLLYTIHKRLGHTESKAERYKLRHFPEQEGVYVLTSVEERLKHISESHKDFVFVSATN